MHKTSYCSNVHAGSDIRETRENLATFACRVKERFSPSQSMGIGLWLSSKSARELVSNPTVADEFGAFLNTNGLDAWTFNGFPYGNFHQDVVKKDVYLPSWSEKSRFDYTVDLLNLIPRFTTSDVLSISTLPLAWGNPPLAADMLAASAAQLQELAMRLQRVEAETGRLVSLCIEPEPGCVIQYSRDIVDFFERYLFKGGDENATRRHIRVCHDVCHAVVMCESQREVFKTYEAAGIEVGKVQISSAVVADFDTIAPADRALAIKQLSGFAEDRYLHQTTVQAASGETTFYEDLPIALRELTEPGAAKGTWRIHFHVPVYLTKFGLLDASQDAIIECMQGCREFSSVEHFEVETYAWNVLPEDLRQEDLAIGIADEMKWFADLAKINLE